MAIVKAQQAAREAEEEMKRMEAEAKKKAEEAAARRKAQEDRIRAKEKAAQKVIDDLIKKDAAQDAKEEKQRIAEEAAEKKEQLRLDELAHEAEAKEQDME